MTKDLYVKSLDDELDWKVIDQLHSVVSQISGFCFEAKKLCVSVAFVVVAVIATFTSDKVDHAVFVAGAAIPLCFWFLDSIGYYYQVKLRAAMNGLRQQISARNSTKLVVAGGADFIEKKRADAPQLNRVLSSFFNHSMWLYPIMIGADLIVWRLFCTGAIA